LTCERLQFFEHYAAHIYTLSATTSVYQQACLKRQLIRFAPARYIDLYADEINKKMPGFNIGKNSVYLSVYDHLCATLSWDGLSLKKHRVPVIHQETDESLYITSDQLDQKTLQHLRQVFAESIWATMQYFDLN